MTATNCVDQGLLFNGTLSAGVNRTGPLNRSGNRPAVVLVTPTGVNLTNIGIEMQDPLGNWVTHPATGAANAGSTYQVAVPAAGLCRFTLTPDAPVAQVDTNSITAPTMGHTYIQTINGHACSFTALDTDETHVATGLAAAIHAARGITGVDAVAVDGNVVCTAIVPGVPFTDVLGGTGVADMSIDPTQANVVAGSAIVWAA